MKRHALFVGVDQYADGHIPNLSCAVSDATDLHGFFKYGAGYDQVELLPNPSSKKEILGKVRSLTSSLGAGDFFLFFFAGHGFRVGENHVLVCSNDLYDDVKYEDDGLPLGQLERRISGTFDSALILDACQSDILATRGGEGIAERDMELIHKVPTVSAGAGTITIVTSCDKGQTAAELSERRHGLFTVAMLDLLNEARRAHSRLDHSDAFRMNLGHRMGEIAARFGLPTEQRPRFSCTGDSCFVLLDGLVSATVTQDASLRPTSQPVSPVMAPVVCPECGMYNVITSTFKCKVCGRDHLCKAHYSKDERCCSDCAAKVQARRVADENARREVEEKVRLAAFPKTGDVKTLVLPGGAEMEMIYCAPGEFMMGSSESEEGRFDDEDLHRVKLTKGFWLGKYPVTQGQWQSVMGSNPSRFKGDARLPVDFLSWNECKKFVEKVNASAKQQLGGEARFPTEAEWEYACRAGTMTAYYWGNALNGDKANCDGNYPCGTTEKGSDLGKTTPVGCYGANPWGFYDMHGNIAERCADWLGDYSGDSVDPKGPASGDARVLRGGSWCWGARHCRSARRQSHEADNSNNANIGFRLCCSAGLRGKWLENDTTTESLSTHGKAMKSVGDLDVLAPISVPQESKEEVLRTMSDAKRDLTPSIAEDNSDRITLPSYPTCIRFKKGDYLLDRYEVLAELGQGGMGIVYKCFDKVGCIEVAIKGLPSELSHDPLFMEEIRDNFQLVSNLRHPGIVGVRNLEADSNTGDYYLVMDLAPGNNLRHWARTHQGKGHLQVKIKIITEIAKVLDYVHDQKIIHRDIKPENVMLDEHGHIHILDFGLAAQIDISGYACQNKCSNSGTPHYKAPEQWRGEPQNAATDQYALGVLAYELIAGCLPFDSSDEATLRKSVLSEPVPVIHGVSAQVNEALARALAKDPLERFADCTDFVSAMNVMSEHSEVIPQMGMEASSNQAGKHKSFFSLFLFGSAQKEFEKGEDFYYGRNGVAQDEIEAIKWYRKAAEHGYADAQFRLGMMYEERRP